MGEARWIIKTGKRLFPEETVHYLIFHMLGGEVGVRFQIVKGSEQGSAKEFGLDHEGSEESFVALDTINGMLKMVIPY